MNIIDILYNIIIRPIQLFFEIVYSIANRTTGNPGVSIIVLSLIMNLLVLPLYMRADKIQEEQREKESKISPGVKHIKSSFKGDERMMILQTYYRQEGYKQTDTLKSSASLLLQIPFFIAAYNFLSNLELLNGVSLGPIRDLGQPDMMLTIGGLALNLLPFIMTGINLISCAIFTKGYPAKTKLQLYTMAVFFLVFLYDSPSGLVFYWTLNNAFSLIKTIIYKLTLPKTALTVLSTALAMGLISYSLIFYNTGNPRRRILVLFIGFILLIPLTLLYLRNKKFKFPVLQKMNNEKIGILAEGLFLATLTGLTIPSAVINSSPLEFADILTHFHPLIYIISSASIALGLFVLWMGVFYRITSENYKHIFEKIALILCVTGIINYMFFGSNPGILTAGLKYLLPGELPYTTTESIINLSVLLAASIVFLLIRDRKPVFSKYAVYSGIIVLLIMSSLNIYNISISYEKAKTNTVSKYTGKPYFTLSKTGKNVIVFMLDRAMNEFIPYIFEERPQLRAQFAGFTYYPNTFSYGQGTNTGSSAIFGGYEYTPIKTRKRNTEKPDDIHNEALKVMPVLFQNNGFEITICDPPFAGGQWVPDLSIYNDYPDFHTYNTEGIFMDPETKSLLINDNKRNFFCYSLMKISPLLLRKTIYNDGIYNNNSPAPISTQIVTGTSLAHGIRESFLKCYHVLTNLKNMTIISNDKENTLLLFQNSTTHEPMLLQEPDYTPEIDIDNTQYDNDHTSRFTLNNVTLTMENEKQIIHYETNMATLIKLGEWFDYMRKNGVYDNTRIILVSDHGKDIHSLSNMEFVDNESKMTCDLEFFYPLLMVKDFDSTSFTVSEELMTNADVPAIATKGIIDHPANPFTGKLLDCKGKYDRDQCIYYFPESGDSSYYWFRVHDDMRKKENWEITAINSDIISDNH